MRILLVTEFNIPSGYQVIAEGLALGLHEQGHEVTVLGAKYDKRQVDYPFKLIPSETPWLAEHVYSLYHHLKPHWIICLFDIPRLLSLAKAMTNPKHEKWNAVWQAANTAAIFPVESQPLCRLWKLGLETHYKARFTFTNYGMQVLADAQVKAIQLPVGLSSDWYVQPASEWSENIPGDYVLTVAANQFRKNLPATMQVMNEFPNLYHVLVTDPGSPDGWELGDLAEQYCKDKSKLIVIPRVTVSQERLKLLYRKAKALLIMSLAEGICLPVLEAQAVGCPVIAPDSTGVAEQIKFGRTVMIENITPYPWGNAHHFWPSVDDAVEKLKEILAKHRIEDAKYPTWSPAAEKLAASLTVYEVAQEASNAIKG